MKHFAEVDIDSPRVREFVKQNTEVFKAAMNGMVAACEMPDASKEELSGLILRSAVAYACGICDTYNVSPETFARLMHFFDEVKIGHAIAPRLH